MIRCRGTFGLALKPAQYLGTFRQVLGQELESYKAIELYILSLVHDTHCARAEFLDDAIVRDCLPNHWRESYFREKGQVNESPVVAAASRGSLAKNRHITH